MPLAPSLLLALCLAAPPSLARAADLLTDLTAASGLQFRYDNGMSGKMYFPEIMGAGVGVLDYDHDGKLDIYLVQGGALGPDIGPAQRKNRAIACSATSAARASCASKMSRPNPASMRAAMAWAWPWPISTTTATMIFTC
ncbi:MAG: hypothetical protein AB7E72_02635 [Lysobacterales bacterium]